MFRNRYAPGAALFLAATFLALGCGEKRGERTTSEAGIAVRLAAVRTDSGAEPVHAVGVLKSRSESRLSFKIGGVIERIALREGAAVRKGEVLATLNLAEINSQVNQAEQAFTKAERDLARVRSLYADSVASLSQLQDAATGFEVARSALTIARFNQQYATIRAPEDGVVTKRLLNENELVGPGTPVLQFSGRQEGWLVSFGAAGRDAVRLRIGDRATARLDAYPDRMFEGRVTEIAAAADPMTGTFEVQVQLRNPGVRLLSGLVAHLDVYPSTDSPRRSIPIEALMEADGMHATVYTVSPDGRTAVGRKITISFIEGSRAAVTGGLDGVERVITDGAAYLSDGAAIRIVDGTPDTEGGR